MCTEPGEPFLLSGCGAKRCVAPEAKALKYYKLEVPGQLADDPVLSMQKPWCFLRRMVANGVFARHVSLQEDMFEMEDKFGDLHVWEHIFENIFETYSIQQCLPNYMETNFQTWRFIVLKLQQSISWGVF